jgi:hypothetical protein
VTHTLQRPLAGRLLPAAAVTAAAAAVLTGCSGATAKASASPTPSSTAAAGARGARGFGGGLSGPIASVGSGSFTVTANSATDTVTYTASTTFDRTSAGSLADVTAGSCVSVVETSGSDASTGSVDAGSVRISAPVNGSCTAGFGGAAGFGGGGGQRPTARPSGAPGGGGFGGGGFGGGSRRGGMLVGSVASVTGSSFIVTVTPTGSSSGTQATTTTDVTVSDSTTYTVTKAASAADLAVGACARVVDAAARPAGSGAPTPAATPTGPVAARSVTLSAPVNGSCGTGARNGGGNAGA